MEKLDVFEWAELVRDYRPRHAGLPPAALRMVLDAKIPVEWLSSVTSVFTGSAPLSMRLAAEFEETYGIPILETYGSTEFLARVAGWSDELHAAWGPKKRGSVGRAFPGVKLRVVDQVSETVLGPDEVGSLEVDSPNRAQGVPAGWVPTSDLARIDADGFLWIVGRSDDVVNRGGFKVHLAEVEAALLEHPRVVEACVVGLPDERLGGVPAALVVSDDAGKPLSEEELIETVRTRLQPYMAPVLVSCQAVMPRNAMLKKDRNLIISMLAAERASREKDLA
jgi:acyl-coenzyme A synthetase/AMP-(fatty) acid ligase